MAEIPMVYNNTGPPSLNVSFTQPELAISRAYIQAFTALAHSPATSAAASTAPASAAFSAALGADGVGVGWAPFNASDRRGLVIGDARAVEAPLGDAGAVCDSIWDAAGYLH